MRLIAAQGSRRLATASKPAARTHSAQSGSGASLVLMGAGLPVEIERATRTLIIPWLNGLRDLEALFELLESDAQMHMSQGHGWGFGRPRSRIRSILAGSIALRLGRRELGLQRLEESLVLGRPGLSAELDVRRAPLDDGVRAAIAQARGTG